MKKTRIVTCVLLLLLVVMLSINVSSFPAVAQGAYHVGVTWGSRYNQNQDEIWEMGYLCLDIRGIFEDNSAWVENNFFGPDTHASYVYQVSDAVKSSGSYDYLATFHVGHMFPYMFEYGHWEWDPYYGYPYWVTDGYVRHYAYYADSGTYYGIKDYAMYSHGGAKNYFTMIWTCSNADLFWGTSNPPDYGYWDTTNGTGRVGMPYAWTKTLGLDKDGYFYPSGSDFCYIGFENISKPLTENFESSQSQNYADFIRSFYYQAVLQNKKIYQALDQAALAMDVSGVDSYSDTELYNGYVEYAQGINWDCRMRILGDGTNYLGVVG